MMPALTWKERNRDEVWCAARRRVAERNNLQLSGVLDYWVLDELQDEALAMIAKPKISITGLWTRTRGDGADGMRCQTIEVLLEIDGEWKLVQSHPLYMSIEQEISHITEPAGIARAQRDPLGD